MDYSVYSSGFYVWTLQATGAHCCVMPFGKIGYNIPFIVIRVRPFLSVAPRNEWNMINWWLQIIGFDT